MGRWYTLSSVSENPRPARTRRLYLMVGQRTTGRSLSTGRGATAAALVRRALRRRDLRPGYNVAVRILAHVLWGVFICCIPDRSGYGHGAASPYGNLSFISRGQRAVEVEGLCSRLCCICWLCLIVYSVVWSVKYSPFLASEIMMLVVADSMFGDTHHLDE